MHTFKEIRDEDFFFCQKNVCDAGEEYRKRGNGVGYFF